MGDTWSDPNCFQCCVACTQEREQEEARARKTGRPAEKKPDCIPIWYRNKVGHYIRCPRCKGNRRGCSFGSLNYGVATWPTVVDSPEGIARRAAEAATRKQTKEGKTKKAVDTAQVGRKRKGKATKVERKDGRDEELLGDAAMTSTQVETCARSSTRDAIAGPSSLSITAGSSGAPSTSATPLQIIGKSYTIFLENLVPYEHVLKDAEVTSLAVESARLEVLAILTREKGEIEYLTTLVRNRRHMGRSLIAKLDAEIAAQEGVLLSEVPSSPEGVIDDEEDVLGDEAE